MILDPKGIITLTVTSPYHIVISKKAVILSAPEISGGKVTYKLRFLDETEYSNYMDNYEDTGLKIIIDDTNNT